ncbi:MAG TPA: sigma-54 dependent transcriptional regulator [Panacibacter sp.]|nr:sigma-54 dependent transcriptional regulator [Panacibacter sp.]HNP45786.1 sigma-54 dependent transcriptional regulator [Panacibacter sp.]
MENYKIFIVEDDPWYGEILEYHLSLNPDYNITRFTSGKDCLANLHNKPNLITIDYSLPDTNGEELYKKIKEINHDIPVIVISGQDDVSTAVSLLKQGVSDYLVKDDNTKDLLWNAVIKIREKQNLKQEIEQLREELGKKYQFDKLIKGNSNAIRKTFSLIEKAARTNINVSITGETGTGKELVAKAIHYHSDRAKKPFIAVNVSAIPKELIESELFGHEKGAFTGAITRKIGKFEEANKGTLFLDEMGEMDPSLQSKLLRVLQERELTRVGGNETVKFDIRLIVATHKNLLDEVKKGNFREDLYYRIMGLPIELPPLRDRDNDIILLAKFFLEEFCKENKMPAIQLSTAAKEKLLKYSYPGNIRELKAVVELAAVMCNGSELSADELQLTSIIKSDALLNEEKTLKSYTIDIIKHYLEKYNSNVLKVAEKLDIGKSTIYKMIQLKEIEI